MGTIPQVLHRSARAIGSHEFMDAVQAICRPRIPHHGTNMPTPVALAISGGVDSMALAYLCSRVKRSNPYFRVADHRVSNFFAIIVDHGYRQGSLEEAQRVKDYLKEHLGFRGVCVSINWRKILGADAAARLHTLSNFETLAREARYQRIANALRYTPVSSLFLAHHEDDQYETVLMRLLAGHGPLGLAGMRPATDLPHTLKIHGSYQSGLIDDQKRQTPVYRLFPTNRQGREIRALLREELLREEDIIEHERRQGRLIGDADPFSLAYLDAPPRGSGSRRAPELEHCSIEDGGVMLYRPLLEFPKERLVATCLENGIPWFEDATNSDPSMTRRNAVRHLVKNHQLPKALQKPAILQLSARCRARSQAQEAEASRLFDKATIDEFHPNVGTVVVRLPEMLEPRARRDGSIYTYIGRQRRAEHLRIVAAITIRKLIKIVTPSDVLTPLQNMQEFVARLFPALAEPEYVSLARSPPKAFALCGVDFSPVIPPESHESQGDGNGNGDVLWHLSRAPHASPALKPYPKRVFSGAWRKDRWLQSDSKPKFSRFWLYDGRFWITLANNLPNEVIVGPLVSERLGRFRDRLPRSERKRLDAMLRRYAPARTRYTLPAVYAIGDIEWAITTTAEAASGGEEEEEEEEGAEDKIRREQHAAASELHWLSCMRDEILNKVKWDPNPDFNLIALPTLGVHLPGIERRVHWDVRYRKVDRAVLNGVQRTRLNRTIAALRPSVGANNGRTGPFAGSLRQRRRRRHLRRCLRLRQQPRQQANISEKTWDQQESAHSYADLEQRNAAVAQYG